MAEKKSSYASSSRIKLLILICFFLSGLTGLIYEILWVKMIVKIIGCAPFAVSIVLTIFMGGLGLGSYLASRTIDRIKEPMKLVKIYGLLELAIGAYALALPVLLVVFRPLYALVYNHLFDHFMIYSFLTFIGCAILLCIPVICMGATLPILCRFYVTKLSHLGTHAGRLYGLNTIGAALGALICGFWLISLLGIWGTLIFAVLINSMIGLFCLLVSYRREKQQPELLVANSRQSSLRETASETKHSKYPGAVVGALVIFAVSGFCAMAYEVIWTKLLGLLVGPTTYSFTIVLVTFISGLALGSMIFGWFADKTQKNIWLLIFTQIAAALFVLATSQLMGNSQMFFAKVILNYKDQFILLSILKAVILFAFMILPTLCLGATFPLVGKIYTQSVSKVGKSIGFAYAMNTIGAVLGSFSAGFFLIPFFGKENSLSLVISIQLLTSLAIAAVIIVKNRMSIVKLAFLAIPVVVGVTLCFHFPMWDRHMLSEGKYQRFDEIEASLRSSSWMETLLQGSKIYAVHKRGEVVYYGEGIGGFTTVIRYSNPLGDFYYSMIISGKPDASSRTDMKTQTLLAHFPMLFHQNPQTVMVLGLASGITAGETLYYPIKQLDVIDINPQVVAASDFFLPWNNNVLSNPKTNLIIQDGRAHLQLTRKKYDVIISEPSNPWMAGLATLFTTDFFSLARDRLNEDGIFVQFCHSYQMNWDLFALVGRSFTQVFPNGLLLITSPAWIGTDYLLVGFKSQNRLNLDNAIRNLPFAQKSKNIILSDPKLLYKLIMSEDLPELFGEGNVNTDNWPRLEFAAPKLMHTGDPVIRENIQSKRWLSSETINIVQHVTTDIDAQIDFAAYALSVNEPFGNMVDLSKTTLSQKERFFKLVETYCAQDTIGFGFFDNDELMQRCYSIQIKTIEDNIDLMPDKAKSYFLLGDLYHLQDMLDEAIANYSKSIQIKPTVPDVHARIGIILNRQNKLDQAIRHFTKALQIRPELSTVRTYLASVLARQGKLEKAVKEYSRVLEVKPDDERIHVNLGVILAKQNKTDQAITHFSKALLNNPDLYVAYDNIQRVLGLCNDLKEAIRLAEQACTITNYENPTLLDTLASVYADADMFPYAVATAEKALDLAKSSKNEKLIEQIQYHIHLYKANRPSVKPE